VGANHKHRKHRNIADAVSALGHRTGTVHLKRHTGGRSASYRFSSSLRQRSASNHTYTLVALTLSLLKEPSHGVMDWVRLTYAYCITQLYSDSHGPVLDDEQ
jgi:hypothetical protein